jgi:hypothetical protein
MELIQLFDKNTQVWIFFISQSSALFSQELGLWLVASEFLQAAYTFSYQNKKKTCWRVINSVMAAVLIGNYTSLAYFNIYECLPKNTWLTCQPQTTIILQIWVTIFNFVALSGAMLWIWL